jgi:hypothetical protein
LEQVDGRIAKDEVGAIVKKRDAYENIEMLEINRLVVDICVEV